MSSTNPATEEEYVEWVRKRREQLAQQKAGFEAKVAEWEAAGDVKEWERAVRKLFCFCYPCAEDRPPSLAVSRRFHGILVQWLAAHIDMDLVLVDGRLIFRGVPVEAMAS